VANKINRTTKTGDREKTTHPRCTEGREVPWPSRGNRVARSGCTLC